jgi:hypothetical protein
VFLANSTDSRINDSYRSIKQSVIHLDVMSIQLLLHQPMLILRMEVLDSVQKLQFPRITPVADVNLTFQVLISLKRYFLLALVNDGLSSSSSPLITLNSHSITQRAVLYFLLMTVLLTTCVVRFAKRTFRIK